MSVPDLQFINRKIAIGDVARALELRFGANGHIHCWHPERHQNADRTASVGINKKTNTVKCFGCGLGPLGTVDLVRAVLELTNPGDAGLWVSERFEVPHLPSGKHLVSPERRIFRVGFESDIGLLVHSGLWALLSPTARSLVPVLLELAERQPKKQNYSIQISYRALMRYSGIASPNAVADALGELQNINWLSAMPGQREPGSAPVRKASTYVLTPRSEDLLELADDNFARMRSDVTTERQLRAEERAKRRKALFTK